MKHICWECKYFKSRANYLEMTQETDDFSPKFPKSVIGVCVVDPDIHEKIRLENPKNANLIRTCQLFEPINLEGLKDKKMTVDELFDNPDGGTPVGVPGGRCPVYLLGKFFGFSDDKISALKSYVDKGYKIEICLQAIGPENGGVTRAVTTLANLGYIDLKSIGTVDDVIAFEVD